MKESNEIEVEMESIEKQMLDREIVKSITKFRLHDIEVGEKAPDQLKYILNLKITRLMECLLVLEKELEMKVNPNEAISTLYHLTEFCVRNKMTLWFAMTHWKFMNQFSKLVLTLIDEFDAKKIVGLVWIYGKIGKHAFKSIKKENYSRELLNSFVQKLMLQKSCGYLTLHDITLLVNGLANLDCTAVPYILDACLETISVHLKTMQDDNFALIVWSLGKLNYSMVYQDFMVKLEKECFARLQRMTVQHLSSVAWGLVRLEVSWAPSYLSHVVNISPTRKEEFLPLGIARLVEACYLLNLHPGDSILRYLANRFSHFRNTAVPAVCTQALPGFSYFGDFPKVMFQYSFQGVRDRYYRLMDVEQMIRYLKGYIMADWTCPYFLELTIDKILKQGSYEELPQVLLRDLWIGIVTHKAKIGPTVERSIPSKLYSWVKSAWEEFERKKPVHVEVEEIVGLLKEMEVVCNGPYWDKEHGLRGDLGGKWRGKTLIFMLINQDHHFHNAKQRLNGDYLWLERMFLRLGYAVGRLPLEAWSELKEQDEKERFLRKVLGTSCFVEEKRASKDTIDLIQMKYINLK